MFTISLHVDDTVPTPELRPLVPPDEFDPSQPWSVLIDKAYNYQYAWNPGGFITLPSNTGIWIERITADDALETFLRPPAFSSGDTWPEILTFDTDRWKWTGAMQHNAYAVLNPLKSIYAATYRVYIGAESDGEPLPGSSRQAGIAGRLAAKPGLTDQGRSKGVGQLDLPSVRRRLQPGGPHQTSDRHPRTVPFPVSRAFRS
ncbi:MAG: hypothetical protein U0795_05195 [Pirellulales bacterium]